MGPVGTGETNASFGTTGVAQRLSPFNWSMALNRQEALVSSQFLLSVGIIVVQLLLGKCQMINLCAYLFNGLLANRCTL